ncbi:MAG: response regulator [Myxococcales bacterium]|nr:response regulator [Myxococcales bacterium]
MRTLTHPPVAPMELLLAEDSPHDARYTEMGLTEAGYDSVLWVRDGEEATDWLFSEGVCAGWPEPSSLKLVLLDLHMPKINGLEVLVRMKASERTQHIPVMIFSSSAMIDFQAEALAAGAAEYAQKPANLDEYLALVKRLVNQWVGPPPTR